MEQVLKEETVIDVEADDMQSLKVALEAHAPPLHVVTRESGFRVSGQTSAEELNRYCFDKGVTLGLLHARKRDLESRFLEITDD